MEFVNSELDANPSPYRRDIMLPSMSNCAEPPSNPEYALLLVAYVVSLPLNLTLSSTTTSIVAPAAVDAIEVQFPLLILYSIVFVKPPKAFHAIVPGVRTLNVR